MHFVIQALRNKRQVEQMYEDAQSRINELTTMNVNLSACRSKLEQELGQIAGDLDEAHKELRVSELDLSFLTILSIVPIQRWKLEKYLLGIGI